VADFKVDLGGSISLTSSLYSVLGDYVVDLEVGEFILVDYVVDFIGRSAPS